MSARYDAMVEAWERDNGRPCPLAVRRQLQTSVYGQPSKRDWRKTEIGKLIKAQAKDRKK